MGLTVLIASLLGSLHCAGMCGPLVAFAVGTADGPSRRARALLHAAYHGGRLAGYACLGAAAGSLGAALDLGGAWVGVQRSAALLTGGLMVAAGCLAFLQYRGLRLPRLAVPGPLQRTLLLGRRAAAALRPLPRAAVLGVLTSLLPCGWLYLFVLIAAGAGSLAGGAAVMAAFWLGTVPVLVFVGFGVQSLASLLGRRLPLATSLLLVAVGLATLGGRLAAPAAAGDSAEETFRRLETRQQLERIHETTPACCRERGA